MTRNNPDDQSPMVEINRETYLMVEEVMRTSATLIRKNQAEIRALTRLLVVATEILNQVSEARDKGLIDFTIDADRLHDRMFAMDNGIRL